MKTRRSAVLICMGLTLPWPVLAAEGFVGWFEHWAEILARAIEAIGIAVIVLGGLAAAVLFLRSLMGATSFSESYHDFRANLGRAILLGLELLVAADIVGTVVVDPTFRNLGVLALIVLIRTFLSFSLEIEIEGRLPWRRAQGAPR